MASSAMMSRPLIDRIFSHNDRDGHLSRNASNIDYKPIPRFRPSNHLDGVITSVEIPDITMISRIRSDGEYLHDHPHDF